MTVPLWRVAVVVPGEPAADAAASALGEYAEAVSAFELSPDGDWLVQGFSIDRPEAAPIELALSLVSAGFGANLHPTIERLPDIDWLKENQESFPPRRIGLFYVHGSHVEDVPPVGKIPLLIDAATAFGTGEHATTEGCLVALGRLARLRRCRRILDLGTGTGILAIAAAKLWQKAVLAVDIDPHSVEVAAENVALNGVAPLVRCAVGSGYAERAIRRRSPFDLIFANILARPLVRLSPGLARNLAPGGTAILSGLLAGQEPMVRIAHQAQGLVFTARIAIGGWHTLVFEKPPRAVP